MLLKVRSVSTNGWVYLDQVQKITTSREWVKTQNEPQQHSGSSQNILAKIIYESVPMTRTEFEAMRAESKDFVDAGNLRVSDCVFKVYDFDVNGNLPISKDGNIFPVLVLDISYSNGNKETYVTGHTDDVFLINDQGKTIERVN